MLWLTFPSLCQVNSCQPCWRCNGMKKITWEKWRRNCDEISTIVCDTSSKRVILKLIKGSTKWKKWPKERDWLEQEGKGDLNHSTAISYAFLKFNRLISRLFLDVSGRIGGGEIMIEKTRNEIKSLTVMKNSFLWFRNIFNNCINSVLCSLNRINLRHGWLLITIQGWRENEWSTAWFERSKENEEDGESGPDTIGLDREVSCYFGK